MELHKTKPVQNKQNPCEDECVTGEESQIKQGNEEVSILTLSEGILRGNPIVFSGNKHE